LQPELVTGTSHGDEEYRESMSIVASIRLDQKAETQAETNENVMRLPSRRTAVRGPTAAANTPVKVPGSPHTQPRTSQVTARKNAGDFDFCAWHFGTTDVLSSALAAAIDSPEASTPTIRSYHKSSKLLTDHFIRKKQDTGRHRSPDYSP